MLEFIRNRAQTWVAWVIVGFIVLVFASWGINEYFTNSGGQNIATVNGKDITTREYQRAVQDQRERLRERLGASYDAQQIESRLRGEVLESLIQQELLVQMGKDEGYRVGDAQLALIIQSMGDFQSEGVFSKDLYEQRLRVQGLSTAAFENRLRRAIIASQIYAGLAETGLATEGGIKNIQRLMTQKRDIGYALIPVSRYSENIEITANEIESYYSDNSSRYSTPERVSVEYLELKASELAKGIEADDEKLRELYEQRKDSFKVGEERKVSHILIAVDEDASGDKKDAAQAKAEDVLEKIRGGSSFSEMAKKHSDDPGSSEEGGDLGYISQGMMEPAFEDAVYNLKQGEVSDLVQTPFGYHVIRLDEIRAGYGRSFEDVRKELEREYRYKEAERDFLDQQETLANLTYENADTLTVAAEELNIKVNNTAMFARQGGEGVAANSKVQKAAFSDDVLKEGVNSEVIEIDVDHVVVLRVKDHEPAMVRPLDEVRDQIKAQLTNLAAREKAQVIGIEIAAKLKNGDDAQAIGEEYKLRWESLGHVRRDYRGADNDIVKLAFRLSSNSQGPAYGGVGLATGDYAIVVNKDIQEGDMEAMSDADKNAIARSLSNIYGNTEYAGFMTQIKQEADIVFTQQNN